MKKNYFLAFCFLLIVSTCFLKNAACKTYIIPITAEWVAQVNTINKGTSQLIYNRLNINPNQGDTIYIQNGTRPTLRFDNITGDSLHPILIQNYGGKCIISNPTSGYVGIAFNNSRYVKVSGKGVSGINYGIKITGIPQGSAFAINNFSSNFEVEYLEIDHIGSSGIVAKTDPACSNYPAYINFIMYDLKIHNNYIHQTGNEGMYIGYTGYAEGNGVNLVCTNPTINAKVLPHPIIGVAIYQNIVDSSGWDGIQVSAAKNVTINDNIITNDSYQDVIYQMSGIMIGEPTIACIFNNFIKNSKGISILDFGIGTKIYNNVIINPGLSKNCRGTFNSTGQIINSSFLYGIYINDKVCQDASVSRLPYFVFHNTIIINKTYPTGAPYYTYAPQGINVNSLNYISGSTISNNLIVIDTNYASTLINGLISGKYQSNSVNGYSISSNPAFISSCALNNLGFNFYSNEINSVGFMDYNAGNYHLNNNSLAVDQAMSSPVSANLYLAKDAEGRDRPAGSAPDFGAFETISTSNQTSGNYTISIPNPISKSTTNTAGIRINTNRAVNSVKLTIIGAGTSYVEQTILSGNGNMVNLISSMNQVSYPTSNLPTLNGLYTIKVYFDSIYVGYANVLIVP